MAKAVNLYDALIEKAFVDHYREGETTFEFDREELESAARDLNIALPKNLGDVIYSFRFRKKLPERVLATQYDGLEWLIELAGVGRYRFRLGPTNRIVPRSDLVTTDIPDATPELIRAYTLDDEQALLAIVRYNRLVDIFLGVAAYSLQNHLRTTVKSMGQIEIDELYVGLDKRGCHYVIPVQAKGGSDQIATVQATQDIRYVGERFPGLRCRALAVQFMDDNIVAFFELTLRGDDIRVLQERHYRLVPANHLDPTQIGDYNDAFNGD